TTSGCAGAAPDAGLYLAHAGQTTSGTTRLQAGRVPAARRKPEIGRRRAARRARSREIASRRRQTSANGPPRTRGDPAEAGSQAVFLNMRKVLKPATSSTGEVFTQSTMLRSAMS